MGDTGRHLLDAPTRVTVAERTVRSHRAVDQTPFPARLGMTATMAALVGVTGIIAAVIAAHPWATTSRKTAPHAPAAIARAAMTPSVAPTIVGPAVAEKPAGAAQRQHPVSLTLTAADRRNCPVTATACVDLARHITWLQAHGKPSFGPVQMEPGQPGSHHPTPRGTFRVAWKAGPTYRSTIYHTVMPWATFFAVGGIAFHGGSLTTSSHGCVHLTDANAHYYSEHLPIGAQVVVF